MNIHEYQAKSLLKKYGVAVPRGGVAFTPAEAVDVAKALALDLKEPVWVVKAQIHAGGRGKGGGVKVVKALESVEAEARRMIGMNLVTHQTGPAGQKVQKVYVEEGCDIKRELYLGLLIDRATSRVTVMASTEGGMEIEEVAASHPEKIMKVAIDPVTGLQPYHARQIAFGLGLKDKQVGKCVSFLQAMYAAFIDLDCSIVEINPLVVTGKDQVIALDAKMTFDDNALFRHTDIEEMRDESEEDPAEILAGKNGLNYVNLDGTIGCMVNGAGLAMATMDIVKLYGGSPANFLDVGGGATKERVTTAFKIILSDKNVQGIFVNIFGGIMRCDIIAEGIIAAAKEVQLHVPLVVRLEGTNVELGKKILAESGLPILSGDNLADGAEKIVKAVMKKAA
ncbi:MAG: ADP-forming succinate--CoA ligase subunit beta [Alphaproteobacteria bacterium]|nr:ADP-forming succinate--CoA ligase subunit beta [Alphaproteobacteria bacterium]